MIDYKLKRSQKGLKNYEKERENSSKYNWRGKQKTKERMKERKKERKISVNYMKIKGGQGKEKSQKQNLVGRLIAR